MRHCLSAMRLRLAELCGCGFHLPLPAERWSQSTSYSERGADSLKHEQSAERLHPPLASKGLGMSHASGRRRNVEGSGPGWVAHSAGTSRRSLWVPWEPDRVGY